jgi:CubicO group peptidase (beta-lactamase class C family)
MKTLLVNSFQILLGRIAATSVCSCTTKKLLSIVLLLFPCVLLLAQKKKSTAAPAGHSKASYHLSDAGRYMKTWWLLGPLPVGQDSSIPDEAAQKNFFEQQPAFVASLTAGEPLPVKENNVSHSWKLFSSNSATINLDSLFSRDFAIVYAVAEIMADVPQQAFLAIGSDDAVKVWHNRKLIHKNWVGRGLTPDQDLIPIPLEKGNNQIVIGVQDMQQAWGFTARLLDKGSLSDRLITASSNGNLDEVNLLLKGGADLQYKNKTGLTALNAARMFGRAEVIKVLEVNGAKPETMPEPEIMVDHLYQAQATGVVPAVAVLVSKDGKVVYKKAFGYSDIGKHEKATTETKFRIGSVTKQFTAAAILKLQEQNRLSVTDKLSKYFPDFPRADEVTLHHLLTHTSGIHSYTNKDEFLQRVLQPVTNEALLNFFKNDPYDFNPGEQYRYNNSGYFLLGYIIEKVSGKSYPQYLKDTFFDPLGMTNTGVHASSLALTNEARGHQRSGNKYEPSLNWDMSWAGGAGALYSTLEDLFKWNEALFNGQVINEKSLASALTPVKLNNGNLPPDGEYGYGLMLGKYRDVGVVAHGGGLHGFITQLSRYPQEKLTVAILTNIAPAEANMNAHTVAQLYLWEKMASQTSYSTVALKPQDLKVYEGRYDFRNGLVMTVTSEGDGLYAQLSGQSRFQIYPSAQDEFFWKVVEAKIKFTRNEKGEVNGGHFTQGGNEIDVVQMKEEKIVSINPAIYKNYTGKYDYGNNFHITVTVENNRLFAQGTNQPKLEIFPLSETEFVARDVNAKIIFVPGPDGKVSKLNLDMAGQKKDAPKIE